MTAASSKYFKATLNIIAGFPRIATCILFHNSRLLCKERINKKKKKPPLFPWFLKESSAAVNPLGDPGSVDSKIGLSYPPAADLFALYFVLTFKWKEKNQMSKIQFYLSTVY